MKRSALFGIALLAGMIVSTSNAQPAQAQFMDALKNALAGQLTGSQNFSADPFNNGFSNSFNDPYNNSFNNNGFNSGAFNAPTTGNSLVDSLLPLVQNSGIGGGLLNNGIGSGLLNNYLPQAQGFSNSGFLGNNYPANLSNGFLNGLPGNFGGAQPVVFNGVTLDSQIYSGPYRGTSHQVESAMNLDWQMTVLREQIGLGVSQGFLMTNDARDFNNELNRLVNQKQRAVRRNGLSFNDSQELVSRLFDLLVRVRQAWYGGSAFGNAGGWDGPARGGRGRFSRADAYGQVMNRNQALDDLYLQMQPSAGFRR